MSSISELTKNCSIRNEFLGSNVGRTTHLQISVTQDHRERQLCQSQAGQTYSYRKRGTVDFSSLFHSYSIYWSRQYLLPVLSSSTAEHQWNWPDLVHEPSFQPMSVLILHVIIEGDYVSVFFLLRSYLTHF